MWKESYLININVINEDTFSQCSSLTNVVIPSSVTSIGLCAFFECLSLYKISLPFFVNSIGDYSFHGCSSLTEISIQSSVTSNWKFCIQRMFITDKNCITFISDNYR